MGTSAKIILVMAALAVLYSLARALRLGSNTGIRDADHAWQLADDALYGFNAVHITLARDKLSALLASAAGDIAIIQRHGPHYTVRALTSLVQCSVRGNWLTVQSGDLPGRTAAFDLGMDAQLWAQRLTTDIRANQTQIRGVKWETIFQI
jgi:hypothetical protein